MVGNLLFNQVRETVDHGTLNAWERGPYFSDLGYIEDPTSNLKPTSAGLQAGATPGFKPVTADYKGSAVGLYTRIANNFLLGEPLPALLSVCAPIRACCHPGWHPLRCARLPRRLKPTLRCGFAAGNYNVNSNLETDDGSSRYLLYNNYFVYSTHATDFAMNAHWDYQVDNVYAYPQGILAGWEPANHACSTDPSAKCPPYKPPATNCYVYNATIYMLGQGALCSTGSNTGPIMDASVIHSNDTNAWLKACEALMTKGVTLAPRASDAVITAQAKLTLGEYPRPYAGP